MKNLAMGISWLGYIRKRFSNPTRNLNPVLLVVAESHATQEAIRRDFEALSCKVIPAFSGFNAWQALQNDPLPDVIILDFKISDEDGPTILRRLFTDKRFSSIPVVPLASVISDKKGNRMNSVANILASQYTKVKTMTFREVPDNPTEFSNTPFDLIVSVSSAIRKRDAAMPTVFRKKLRDLTRILVEGEGIPYLQ